MPIVVVAGLGIYLLVALRRVYGQSWIKTLVKLLLLVMLYVNTFTVAFAITAFIILLLF